jgi:thiamine biosynthesis lipoprotein
MSSVTFGAMGTGIDVWCGDVDAAEEVRSWFSKVESVCTRFRPGSELSRINRSPAGMVILSSMLTEVMQAADRARSITGGLVDVGVGGDVVAWGYDRSFEQVRDVEDTPSRRTRPRWTLQGHALIRGPGTLIDLGGVAKGWACDRAVERGLASVVSAGGDIRSSDPRTVVSVRDPFGELVARVNVGVGALATSSTSRRRWKAGDREVSHIIDPRTMAPVSSPVMSATVVAASAVDAEAGAKATLLMGEDSLVWADGADWIAGALVVWHDGSVYATPGLEVAA